MEIKNELVQAIANYLAQKPYNEVVGLLNAIQQAAKIKPEPKPEPKKEDKKDEKK